MKPKRKRYAAPAALVPAGLGAGAADPAATPSRVWIPDGHVNAVAVSGTTADVGGRFGIAGGGRAHDRATAWETRRSL